jgi:hypothetical protein
MCRDGSFWVQVFFGAAALFVAMSLLGAWTYANRVGRPISPPFFKKQKKRMLRHPQSPGYETGE